MNLFKRPPKSVEARSSTPDGIILYAIGDIHGRVDLLEGLTKRLIDDLDQGAETRALLVLLGDYIDRGPSSRAVIDHILDLSHNSPFEVHPLRGNHDDFLLQFLTQPSMGPQWSAYGGLDTIASYIGRSPGLSASAEVWELVRDDLVQAMPPEHLAFFQSLKTYFVCGDYCFVHAGLRPGVAISDQTDHDLLTIRTEFLTSKRPFEKRVVYGHTPSVEPVIEPYRIGIDTGAFATGVLSCLKLFGPEIEIIQARS